MVIFKVTNDGELKSIYDENTCGFRPDEWLEVFKDCISEAHGFMFLNHQGSHGVKVMKNFDHYFMVTDDDPQFT